MMNVTFHRQCGGLYTIQDEQLILIKFPRYVDGVDDQPVRCNGCTNIL